MNKIKNHSKELIILTILLAVAVSVVNAAVFVYYPISINAVWQEPKVYFKQGENADGDDYDLGQNNYITATIEDDGTSATIEVHPCKWQTTLYKNVLEIHNDEDHNVYLWFMVKESDFTNAEATGELLILDGSSNLLATIDLANTDLQPNNAITLDSNEVLYVWLRFIVTGDTAPTDTYSATVGMFYSNVEETPPTDLLP